MRPIERGPWPLDEDSKKKVFKKYGNARGDLIDRLGEYCSYCERSILASLAVEHMLAKDLHPHLEKEWSNFLLSCANCNSNKSVKDIQLDDYFWPDRDNTFRALAYGPDAQIKVAGGLRPEQQDRARRTLELTGLDKRPPPVNLRGSSDRRWGHRHATWSVAAFWRDWLAEDPGNEKLRQAIIKAARNSKGFWSVWMTVFEKYPEVRADFIEAFPGTSSSCFDKRANPVQRPGGAV
ncbi:MAG: HNH endonuclease [Planctomycetes bacterium]|nr:HNH endonuclease [Planctomycetota bacterium]